MIIVARDGAIKRYLCSLTNSPAASRNRLCPFCSAHLCGLSPPVQLPLNDNAFFRSPVGEYCVFAASCEGSLQQQRS